MTYAADITDASQHILQEAFTKVGHELETTQKSLVIERMVSNMTRVFEGDECTWQLPQSTASLKSFQILVIQLSAAPVRAWTPGSAAKGARAASRTAAFILTSWECDSSRH